MCGLVGMAGNLHNSHSKMFRDMLIFDTVRGFDSTGVAFKSMDKKKKCVVEKTVGNPNNLWDYGASDIFDTKGVFKTIPMVAIGHNRAATLGTVNEGNAHPFECEHIVGAHNGTLIDWRDLVGYVENEVDSKSIFQHIAKKGVADCWKSFTGAAALTYYDEDAETINLIRNEERPLYCVRSRLKDALFWASEPWMISVAAERNNIALEENEEKKPAIILLKPHYLHTFRVTPTSIKLEEPVELEKKPDPQPTWTETLGRVGGGFRGNHRNSHYESPTKTKTGPANKGWAGNKEKAGKELRGAKFRLQYPISGQMYGSSGTCYIVGYLVDNNNKSTNVRVEIYPESWEDFYVWVERIELQTDLTRYEIIERPRISYTSGKLFHAYQISGHGVRRVLPPSGEVKKEEKSFEERMDTLFKKENEKKEESNVICLYQGPMGEFLTKEKWEKLLYEYVPDGCCTGCGNPISTEDHKEILWHGPHVILCEFCQKDPTVASYFNGTTLANNMR